MTNKKNVVDQDDGQFKYPKHPMVGWYDPRQLIQTAKSVVVSTLFGRHSDFRFLEALSVKNEIHRFDDHNNEVFWFDYTADVGDGWNSSYAIAYWLAQPELNLCYGDSEKYNTKRGRILIFGGDAVYPVASRDAYQEKLVQCYEYALAHTAEDKSPTMFAIPGNHDWYDSLTSFMRLFCSERWIGGWRTKQRASYFAAKLPHGWWLIGIDIQLNSDIDDAQVKFLRYVADQIRENEHIILCIAEPHWIYAKIHSINKKDHIESNLVFVEENIFKHKIKAFIAGDLHHYRRHASPEGIQKITAGGGGSFLHPTHGPDLRSLADNFELQKSFPDLETSRRLTWRNLLFPILNPTFGFVTAILYMLTGWAAHLDLSKYSLNDFNPALGAAFNTALNEPLAAFWITFIFIGFYLFTDTHSKWYRFIAGTLHGSSHLLAVFGLGWLTSYLTMTKFGLEFTSSYQMLSAGALMFVGGWLTGSMIMGLYLLISLNGFGRHTNEAFSSLKIQDWKNFLRLKIDADGSLTIFAVGLKRVPRKWKRMDERGEGSSYVPDPDDERATEPQLIDKVVLEKKKFI